MGSRVRLKHLVRRMKFEDIVEDIAILSGDGICIAYRGDDGGVPEILWVNQAFCEMFHLTEATAIGLHPQEIHDLGYRKDFQASVDDAVTSGRNALTMDTLCLRQDGSSFWASVKMTLLQDQTGKGRHSVAFIRDIDVLKNREQSAELALIENQHLLTVNEAMKTRLISAINMIPDPFGIYDARDRLMIWNPAFAKNASHDPNFVKKGMKKEFIVRNAMAEGLFDVPDGEEDAYVTDYLNDWAKKNCETKMARIGGRDYRLSHTTAHNGDRIVLGVDVSEHLRQQIELERYAKKLEHANQEITTQALHDELTGLGNRRYLQARLQTMIDQHNRDGTNIAALHIDLDRFKQINDTMGHAAGDHVLRVVADILRRKVRGDDVIARIGGDEFVILMAAPDGSDKPEILADRVVKEVSKPIPFDGRLCRLGASVGIARTPMIEPKDLLTCSDIALYKAKTGGRSTKATFDKADLEHLQAMKSLGDDIQRALENEEFVPYFQPQFDAATGDVVAYEVLARWDHPSRGVLLPDAFLDAASEFQVDEQIDAMIFKSAMRDCARLLGDTATPPEIAFNVSLARVMSDALLMDIDACAYPGCLAFELIETTFFDGKSDATLARLKLLKSLGVQLEVDDFGSGSASIVGLRHVNPARVKIDHRLVDSVETSHSARKLVQSIIDIGRTLDLGITGEGVETQDQEHILRDIGCDRLQGFYLGKPRPLAAQIPQSTRRRA